MLMQLFSNHSLDLEVLIARLLDSPRTVSVKKEMAIVWPGSREIASKPDVIAERVNPYDFNTRFFDAYDIKTGLRNSDSVRRQAKRYFKVIDLYNREAGLGLIPRYVHVNFRAGSYRRVRREDLV